MAFLRRSFKLSLRYIGSDIRRRRGGPVFSLSVEEKGEILCKVYEGEAVEPTTRFGREGETLRAGPLAVGVAFLAAEVVGELDLFISRRPSVFELPKPADNVLTFIHEIPYSLNLAPPIEWVWGLSLEREEGQKL